MKKLVKRCTLSLLIVLFGTSLQSSVAFGQDQTVALAHVGRIPAQNSYALQVVDSYQKGFSALYPSGPNGIPKFCKSLEDAGCEGNLSAETVLPVCIDELSENCIESLVVLDENSNRRELSYIRSINTKDGYIYEASISKGLPKPGQISLWKEETSEGIRFFSVNASLASRSSGSGTSRAFKATDLSIEINQYVERAETIPLGIGPMQGSVSAGWNPPASLKNIQCAWHEVGICGVKQILNVSQKIQLQIRISSSISGWVYGRLRGQDVTIEEIAGGQNRLRIAGFPVEVPGILAEIDYSKDSDLVSEYDRVTRLQRFYPITLPSTMYVLADAGESSILSVFSRVLDDRAQYAYTKWSIYTKPFLYVGATSLSGLKLQECIGKEKGLQGFVTSNAPIYESTPPVFDGESLNYKVSGAHFKSDGSVFEGSYDLSIRSSLARCIYGFSSAPISASVSVVNSDGETTVKTTTFNETTNGWMNFSAAGFTFSSPTIKIALNQEKSPEPSPTPEPTVTKKKNKTILCQKKKTVKKISGINPKCPAGYKKAN